MSDDSIIHRVRALFRKAKDPASTKEEAAAFLVKAQELMARHGIEKVLLESKEAEDLRVTYKIKKVNYETGRQKYETDEYIANIIGSCFFVRVLWNESWDLVTTVRKGETFRSLKKRLVYVLVGTEEDIEVAKMVIEELHPMMRHLLSKHLRARGLTWNAETCHSFFSGFSGEYIGNNRKARDTAALEAGENVAERFAIVVKGKEEQIDEHIKSKITTVRSRYRSGATSGGFDNHAYNSGREKGKNVKLGLKKLT